jgi:hypothetical protein
MRGPWQPLLALLIFCQFCCVAAAQEKPFSQEEWQRGFDELMHPKPGDPKLEAIAKAKDSQEMLCRKQYIENNAKLDSSWNDLAERACQACDKVVIAAGNASYNAHKITTPLTADMDKSIRSAREMCRFSGQMEAQQLVWDRKAEADKVKSDALKIQYAAKITPAMACSTQAAKIYALATSESAESIATASFEKCHDLWGEAANFSLNLFPNLPESDRWDALKQGWVEHGISAVVDERARQRIDHPPAADVPAPNAKQGDTGI